METQFARTLRGEGGGSNLIPQIASAIGVPMNCASQSVHFWTTPIWPVPRFVPRMSRWRPICSFLAHSHLACPEICTENVP